MKVRTAWTGTAMLVLLLAGAAVQATTISSINMEVRRSGYTVLASDDPASLLAQFNLGSLVCDVSLSSLDMVGSNQTCGGPLTDIATLFSIDFSQDSATMWQFGADWGRGGIAFLTNGGSGYLGPLTGDYWWALDWNNSDVIDFTINGSGSATLNLLGFEGCCGGAMSLRYSNDYGRTWTVATVNAVPEPSTLALLGLGLLGVGLAVRSRRTTLVDERAKG